MLLKLENKLDVKVFILYLMNKVGEPLEYTTVNDIVLQDEFVNYFDFALCFSELLDAGQIEDVGGEGTVRLYSISQSGRESLESYESSLLSVIRERASRSALRLIAYQRTGNRIQSTITECGDGYMLKCSIVDKHKTLFSTEVYLTDRAYAERMKANYEERAEVVFKGSLALLSGDVNFIFE